MGEPHVLSALIAKRAELAGEVGAAERRVDQLRADLVHLDAVLRMFDPAAEPGAIPSKRPYRRRRQWFSDGELPRRSLEALRTAPAPLTPSDIARQVMAAKGLPVGDEGTFLAIRKCVQHYLTRQRGKLVEPAGKSGKDGLWRLVGQVT